MVDDEALQYVRPALSQAGETYSPPPAGHQIKELKLKSKTGEYLVTIMDARILCDGMANTPKHTLPT